MHLWLLWTPGQSSFSRDPRITRFLRGTLRFRPALVGGPIVLQAFYPPPFNTPDQEPKLNLLSQVRALDAYVHRAALWHKSEQLFVYFGSLKNWVPCI